MDSQVERFSQKSIEIVTEAALLPNELVKELEELSPELQKSWQTKQMWRTDTEARFSVLNDTSFPTPDSKYWQAVREQNCFLENLVQLSYDYRKLQAQLKFTDAELRELEQTLSSLTGIDRLKIEALIDEKRAEIDEKLWNVAQFQLAAKHRVREIKMWQSIKEELKPQLKYGEDDVDKHQYESYLLRFKKEIQNQLCGLGKPTQVGEINNLIGQFETLINAPENAKLLEHLGLSNTKALFTDWRNSTQLKIENPNGNVD